MLMDLVQTNPIETEFDDSIAKVTILNSPIKVSTIPDNIL